MAKSHLLIDPNGDLFDAADVRLVKQTDSGVILLAEKGRFLHLIKETDTERARLIRDEAAKLVMAINQNRKYEPQWPGQRVTSPAK